jgi:hypothetical protein
MSYYGPDRNDRRSISAWAWFMIVILAIFIIGGIGLTYLNFAGRWATAPTEVFSVDNVRDLSRQANQMRTQLDAQLANIRVIDDQMRSLEEQYGEDQSTWPQGKDEEYRQLRVQRDNRIASFNTACADYQALWADEWRSLPAPDDLDTYCEYVN